MRKRKNRTALLWAMVSGLTIQAFMPAASIYGSVENYRNESMERAATTSNGIRAGEALPKPEISGRRETEEETNVISPNDLRISATGNLWDGWTGDMDFPGEGTETKPYQLSSLAHLMGLSELVAAGNSFRGTYFELTQDVDLGNLNLNNGSWNPIGWYTCEEDLGKDITHGFSGSFDGCGNTIKGLKIHRGETAPDYAGLFGLIDGGSICDLKIEAHEIYGGDRTGVLAGAVTGDSCIRNVQVSGYVRGTGDAGGIAGVVEGKGGRVVIENCQARGIAVLSEGGSSFTGGIVGQAAGADLVDNVVMTQNTSGDRIRGNGYVGGIAGRMDDANIYNSYVEGTIGGNGAKAVGGMVGMYESGNLILARFAGDIGRTNNGTASREGTFVGMRQGVFTYGTEKGSNISYLFANTAGKAKTVFGSGQDGDNVFTSRAHIGYWTDNGTRYATVAGIMENGCQDRYFYEELEDGVRYLVTQKLEREFTADGYDRDLPFSLDHYAPGYQGEPVRGYLLSVPRIDAANANGTYDTDVASLTAVPTGSNTYYRTFDKDHCGAVAPGVTVSVATAAKNSGGSRYQMVMDAAEQGGVRPPAYIDESGEKQPMTYVNGGSYSFRMPECDTEINAEYIKVTTEIVLTPAETTISVTQTRKGDRKNPDIVTEVRDENGVLAARYINGNLDTAVEVQPVRIHGELNRTGNAADHTLMWSVDDKNLLTLTSPAGYTSEDAAVMPSLDSNFIHGILNREIQKQADNDYMEAISPNVYEQSAVVTAASDPRTSADQKPVYANCKVNVTLQILDQTTRRVEGLNLNESNMVCTITRRLTGSRINPEETITCTEPVILAADLYPQQPFYKNVIWRDQESGQIIKLTPTGEHQENCRIELRFDAAGKANPAWIQNVIREDDQLRKADPYRKLEGQAVHEEVVTAVAQDQTHGIVEAKCTITLRFVTEDETEIWPRQVKILPSRREYRLSVVRSGDSEKTSIKYEGFEDVRLQTSLEPAWAEDKLHQPYLKNITWSSTVPGILAVSEEGVMSPVKNAPWIAETMNAASAAGSKKAESEKRVLIQAQAEKGEAKDTVEVVIRLTAEDQTVKYQKSSSGGSGRIGGSRDSGPGVEGIMTGNSIKKPAIGSPYIGIQGKQGTWTQTAGGEWTLTVDGHICKNEWVYVQNPYADSKKGQNSSDWFRFDAQGHMVTGWYTDADGRRYYLNPVSDNTKGRMVTGWNWIGGNDRQLCCYYFQEISDGYRGSLFKDGKTPDGYFVNSQGEWIVEKQVQKK